MAKQTEILTFVNNNTNQQYRTADMCQQIGCSLPTLLKFIKNNPERFTKVSHGVYTIKAQTMSVGSSSLEHVSIVHEEMTPVSEVINQQNEEPSHHRPIFDW